MLEWLKRHAWKACKRPKRFGGSNPPLSAINLDNQGFTQSVHDLYMKTPDFAKISGVFCCYPKTIFPPKDIHKEKAPTEAGAN